MKLSITVALLFISSSIAMQPAKPVIKCKKQNLERLTDWSKIDYLGTLENCIKEHDPNGKNNMENIDILMNVKCDEYDMKERFDEVTLKASKHGKLDLLKHCVENDKGAHLISIRVVSEAISKNNMEMLEYLVSLGTYAYHDPAHISEHLAEVPNEGERLLDLFSKNSEPTQDPGFILSSVLYNIGSVLKLAEQIDLTKLPDPDIDVNISEQVDSLGQQISALIRQGSLVSIPVGLMEKIINEFVSNLESPDPSTFERFVASLGKPIDKSKQSQLSKDICAAFRAEVPGISFQFTEDFGFLQLLMDTIKAISGQCKEKEKKAAFITAAMYLLKNHIVPTVLSLQLPAAIDEVVGKEYSGADFSTANPDTLKKLNLIVGPISLFVMIITKLVPIAAQSVAAKRNTYDANIISILSSIDSKIALKNLIKFYGLEVSHGILKFVGHSSKQADELFKLIIQKTNGALQLGTDLPVKQRVSLKSFHFEDLVKIYDEGMSKVIESEIEEARKVIQGSRPDGVRIDDFRKDFETYVFIEFIRLVGDKMDIILAPFTKAVAPPGGLKGGSTESTKGIQTSSSGSEDEVIDLEEDSIVEATEAPTKRTEAPKTVKKTSAASSFSFGASTVAILIGGAAAILL